MSWSKKGKKYLVESTSKGTVFNLDGLTVKQPVMSQKEAVEFLELNGFKGFEIDVERVAVKNAVKKSKTLD